MGDEYEASVCGGNWWSSSRSIYGSSLCASSVPLGNSNFAWTNDHLLDMKSSCRSNDESGNSDESVVLQELPKHDSTLQILGIGLNSSSTPDNWNHNTLMHGSDRGESNYSSIILQEDLNSSMTYQQESGVDCSSDSFKQDFTLGMNHPITSSTNTTDHDPSTNTMISSTFPMNTSPFSNYPTSLLQTLLDNDPPQQQLQPSLFASNNNQPMNFPTSSLNYRPDLNNFSSSLPKFPNSLLLPKQTPSDHFPNYSINATASSLYNTSSATSLNNMPSNLLPSMHQQLLQSQTFNEKSRVPKGSSKCNVEEVRESRVSKKSGNNEATVKRARIETPSPLPTFKVRKEKLGDRITALQQLVSPFGKTDTASVLHEAIEYIKFLHDQVNVLSTPYLKNGSTPQHQQNVDKVKEEDLRSRGLCLVPISSTFPVATETSTDFWTPNFGGTFR